MRDVYARRDAAHPVSYGEEAIKPGETRHLKFRFRPLPDEGRAVSATAKPKSMLLDDDVLLGEGCLFLSTLKHRRERDAELVSEIERVLETAAASKRGTRAAMKSALEGLSKLPSWQGVVTVTKSIVTEALRRAGSGVPDPKALPALVAYVHDWADAAPAAVAAADRVKLSPEQTEGCSPGD